MVHNALFTFQKNLLPKIEMGTSRLNKGQNHNKQWKYGAFRKYLDLAPFNI